MTNPLGFFMRWSSRKIAAEHVRILDVPSAEQREVSAAKEAPEGPARYLNLPAIEDITADSDVSGFLEPGVPPELTRAALRRVWSVDEEIRDFIGPADYAWNFHAPETMLGFEPLNMSDTVRDSLVAMLFQAPRKPEGAKSEAGNAEEADKEASDTPQNIRPPHVPEIAAVEEQKEVVPEDRVLPLRRNHGGALPL